MKKIFIFVLGFILGFIVATSSTNNYEKSIDMFQKPGNIITKEPGKVFQNLALINERSYENSKEEPLTETELRAFRKFIQGTEEVLAYNSFPYDNETFMTMASFFIQFLSIIPA